MRHELRTVATVSVVLAATAVIAAGLTSGTTTTALDDDRAAASPRSEDPAEALDAVRAEVHTDPRGLRVVTVEVPNRSAERSDYAVVLAPTDANGDVLGMAQVGLLDVEPGEVAVASAELVPSQHAAVSAGVVEVQRVPSPAPAQLGVVDVTGSVTVRDTGATGGVRTAVLTVTNPTPATVDVEVTVAAVTDGMPRRRLGTQVVHVPEVPAAATVTIDVALADLDPAAGTSIEVRAAHAASPAP